MIDSVRELWADRKSGQGRINITVFFVNIFLFLAHVLLMIIYCIANHKFMICVNVFSLLVYFIYIPSCWKNINRYMGISFLEIWVHMICAILSFGWGPCYQNWSFAIIAAYFLPSFAPDSQITKKRPIFIAVVVVLTYYVLAICIALLNIKVYQPLSDIESRVLFVLNNLFTFITITMFAIFYTGRTSRKQYELTRKAEYDELTSLYNRHALQGIGTAMRHDAASKTGTYAVAIIDIDFFKRINDTYGHASGDMVLKDLSYILRSYSIKGICPGRWGGEEFIMIAPYNIDFDEFVIILEKLREKVEKHLFQIEDSKKINLTISIGVFESKSSVGLENAVSMADKNLYKAKENGRNKVVY